MIKLAFFGSRTLSDNRAKILMYEAIELHKPEEIVTAGEPDGICRLAQEVARELAIPLKLFFLNFKYLRGAFEHRSSDVIKYADHVVLIHDGVSKGTSNELTQCKKMNREYTYLTLEPEHQKEPVPVDWTKLPEDFS